MPEEGGEVLAAEMRELSLDTNTFIDLLDPRTFDAGRVASERKSSLLPVSTSSLPRSTMDA